MEPTQSVEASGEALSQGGKSILAYNDMIQNRDADDLADLNQSACGREIGLARFEVSTWMVVRDQNGYGVVLDGPAKCFTRMDLTLIHKSHRNLSDLDDLIIAIQVKYQEDFLRGAANFRQGR